MNDKSTQVLSTGRNDLCWCGSGKKYKKCCLGTVDDRERKNTVHYQKNMTSKMGHLNNNMLCKSSEELGLSSLSEMILEFADDMLRHSDNYQEQKMAVELEIEIWSECTRLISLIIIYYNMNLLSKLYEVALANNDTAAIEYLKHISPVASQHVQ